ncbi:hypothetical protein SynPROS91_02099 [Synechococcus sp. PROS-9-1]|nr:hypothetical protein SynPROS91_02099 [Synechococcus sp. PROS-9-1]
MCCKFLETSPPDASRVQICLVFVVWPVARAEALRRTVDGWPVF